MPSKSILWKSHFYTIHRDLNKMIVWWNLAHRAVCDIQTFLIFTWHLLNKHVCYCSMAKEWLIILSSIKITKIPRSVSYLIDVLDSYVYCFFWKVKGLGLIFMCNFKCLRKLKIFVSYLIINSGHSYVYTIIDILLHNQC
jgi:hypothetical protein